jgi:GNAT superfamily N-acetyltransferase
MHGYDTIVPVVPAVQLAPVFDGKQWPLLWHKAMQQSIYKPKKDFIEPSKYASIIDGVGYMVRGFEISAHLHNGSKIGLIKIDDGWLSFIEVDPDHQKRGIGSRLIRLAKSHFHDFKIACVRDSSAYMYSLTPEGINLIKSCLRKRIIARSQCKGPKEVLLADEASCDPGLAVTWLLPDGLVVPDGLLSQCSI